MRNLRHSEIDNCSLLEFDFCTEEEQTIYTITRIEEADFGCEGRAGGLCSDGEGLS